MMLRLPSKSYTKNLLSKLLTEVFMKKIALIGDGKVGSKFAELVREDPAHYQLSIFNINRPPTKESLQGHDVIMSFVPGAAFQEMIGLLVEVKLPVVVGSTGFTWPENLNQTLIQNKVRWIHASNFSLGMALIHAMLQILGRAKFLSDNLQCHIHEIHHIHKKDAPSGTALAWQKWLNLPAEITSERIGEEIGTHELKMRLPFEEITVRHQALDRKIFAEGALWAIHQILANEAIPYGLHHFADLTAQLLTSPLEK